MNISKKKILSFIIIFSFFVFDVALAAQSFDFNASIPQTGLPDSGGGIKAILEKVLMWVLSIIGMIAIISFVVSGIQYFISAGDEKKMETAKRNATYSVIGIIIAIAGFVIVKAIDTALRASGTF